MPQKLSAVVITFNEQKRIGVTLDALSFCDEIVVVDSGSTDRTREICTGRGCRFLERPFDGFGMQKRFAVEQARNDWVLNVDADEVVSDALRTEIPAIMRDRTDRVFGYRVHTPLVFMGRVMSVAGTDMHVRLFNRHAGTFTSDAVHERVQITGPVRDLAGPLLHYSYENLADYLGKFNRFTSTAAQEMYNRGKRGGRMQAWVRFPLTFLTVYLFRRHIMFGLPGLVWSLLSALYPVVKYAKLTELCTTPEKPTV